MRIQFKRFTEMSCFTLRGTLSEPEFKLLQVGFESIVKDLENMWVINFTEAQISASILPQLIALKKHLEKVSKQKIFWISREKSLADFGTINLLASRYQGSKMRQICDKLIIDDEIYELEKEIKSLEEEIQKLGFDEHSSQKAIIQNQIVKTQKTTLDSCLKFQRHRKSAAKPIPSEVEELDLKIKSAIDQFEKAFQQGQVDL